MRQLKALWAYASWCAQAPASAPACDSFWTWVAVAAVTACALIGLYIIRKMAKNFLAVRAERQRLAERSRVADPETMSRYRVEDEKLHPDPPQQEDIERRIRQALDERKLEPRRPQVNSKTESPK